jgi:hypothetical protein
MNTYSNLLKIRQRGKPIPYGGDGIIREDGDANYGFKYLKGNSEGLRLLPELIRDPALLGLAGAINGIGTGLFSVGCVSGEVADENGVRHTGYIEFSFNSKALSSDAGNYFPIFFHFDRFLHESKFDIPVSYQWEIEGASFLEADHHGFTVAVFVNTHYCDSLDRATANWARALATLGYYLQSVTTGKTDYIYPQ